MWFDAKQQLFSIACKTSLYHHHLRAREEEEEEQEQEKGGDAEKEAEEEEEEEEEEEDTPIAFGAFGSSPPSSSLRDTEKEAAEGAASGPNAAALMVMEQMLGLRRKLVATLRQLIDVHAR